MVKLSIDTLHLLHTLATSAFTHTSIQGLHSKQSESSRLDTLDWQIADICILLATYVIPSSPHPYKHTYATAAHSINE